MSASKTICPVSRTHFRRHAQALECQIAGQLVAAGVKEFKPQAGKPQGSLGWYFGDKVHVRVNGVLCKAQVGLTITLVNSSEAPEMMAGDEDTAA